MACVPQSELKYQQDACNRRPILERAPCLVRLIPCPPAGPPTVDATRADITLLGVYRTCDPQPTTLAPYPPTRPMPNEATAEAALTRLQTQSVQASALEFVLQSRARKARKLELTWGFWLGLGLVGLGGTALYLKSR